VGLIYPENNDQLLLAGMPIRKTNFADGEYLTFDNIKKQWIAFKPTEGNNIVLSYDINDNVETISTYENNILRVLTTLTWDGDKVTTIIKVDYRLKFTETINLTYSGDNVTEITRTKERN